jgi:PAS domain S-box-containing protein
MADLRTSASAPPPVSQQIEWACRALGEIRRQLSSVSRYGGGEITPDLLRAAVDDCPEAVFVTDRKAQIVMVNGVAARLLGSSTRELQRLTLWDITHVSVQTEFDVLWREFLRAGRQRGQYAIRHKDGSIVELVYCSQTHIIPERHATVVCAIK